VRASLLFSFLPAGLSRFARGQLELFFAELFCASMPAGASNSFAIFLCGFVLHRKRR
jgi:hypothetical protein